jgi:hypothetical protein
MKVLVVLLALLVSSLPGSPAHAHALEPGYLEIEPLGEGEWRVTWRKPQVGGQPMQIDAVLPEGCSPRRGPDPRFDGRAFVSGWIAKCETPISEGELFIEGLAQTATDVLVRYVPEAGSSAQTLRLTPGNDSVV